MRHRRALAFTLLAALALSVTAVTASASASAAQHRGPRATPLPPVESLITEGVTVEGPLVNSINLPQLR
ncbi:hypothetical protein GCM10010277_63550 [Streptomyces longisporoflavus]|uniref:hypothetical protein n=1 Tax=Streptomyces longisporoflavus TaxID=28044 RepID=UPI00167E898C|nr:hypothetical protein [Streptomyces longisporoflavus]GGV59725.1 hypothetical protein GCM10010277_63550 [Streptomyces longisporoflavus]